MGVVKGTRNCIPGGPSGPRTYSRAFRRCCFPTVEFHPPLFIAGILSPPQNLHLPSSYLKGCYFLFLLNKRKSTLKKEGMPYLGPRCFDTTPLTASNLHMLSHVSIPTEIAPTAHTSATPTSATIATSATSATSSSSDSSLSNLTTTSTDSTSLGNNTHIHDDEATTTIDDSKTIILASRPPSPPVTPTLVRKKSGELLKSSLKLNEYLHRSNSMPNTKNVKFADDLENVKYFNKFQKPTAVSIHSQYIHDSSDDSDSDSIFDDDDDDDDDESDNSSSIQKWEITHNDTPHNQNSLNFIRLNTQNEVILESLKLNSSKNALIGFIFVQNISFKKELIIKLTYDNWQSFIEIDNSNYISSNHLFNYSSNVNYDKFSFIIKLDLLTTFSKELNIKFCIEYISNGKSYWDNNNGKDYSVQLHKLSKNHQSSLSLSSSSSSPSLSPSPMFDLDDNIKLKNNYNFIDSFNISPRQPLKLLLKHKPIFQLKKVKSDSCLFDLNYTLNRQQLEQPDGNLIKPPHCIPRDYNKLVENFCFYGNSDPLTSKDQNYSQQHKIL